MHKALIGIIGPSGSGKSSSLEHLNPNTTALLDVERKGFPFRQAQHFKYLIPISSCAELEVKIAECIKNPEITLIVIDSFTSFLKMLKRVSSDAFKGWEIWNYYNRKVRDLLDKSKNDRCMVAFIAIDEIVKIPQPDGSEQAARRVWVQGKEHEGKIEEEFVLVFFTEVKRNTTTSKMEYFFRTNTDGTSSAKTPKGMFDSELIPNDLAAALAKAKAWWLEDENKTTTP